MNNDISVRIFNSAPAISRERAINILAQLLDIESDDVDINKYASQLIWFVDKPDIMFTASRL
jgi:hypothetical protein